MAFIHKVEPLKNEPSEFHRAPPELCSEYASVFTNNCDYYVKIKRVPVHCISTIKLCYKLRYNVSQSLNICAWGEKEEVRDARGGRGFIWLGGGGDALDRKGVGIYYDGM